MFSGPLDIAKPAMRTGIERVDSQRLLQLNFGLVVVSLREQHASQAHSVISELPVKIYGLPGILKGSIEQLLIAVGLILHQ